MHTHKLFVYIENPTKVQTVLHSQQLTQENPYFHEIQKLQYFVNHFNYVLLYDSRISRLNF